MPHSSSKYVLKKDDFCSVLQFFNVPPIICAQKYKCKSMPDTDFFNQPILIAEMFFVLGAKIYNEEFIERGCHLDWHDGGFLFKGTVQRPEASLGFSTQITSKS